MTSQKKHPVAFLLCVEGLRFFLAMVVEVEAFPLVSRVKVKESLEKERE